MGVGGKMAVEYISREAVLALKKPFPTSKDSITLYQQYFISPTTVEKIPAADVVPVVRCGDCKWFQINMRQDGYLPKGVPECECRHWCGACDPTDFCSYGALIDKDGDSDGV